MRGEETEEAEGGGESEGEDGIPLEVELSFVAVVEGDQTSGLPAEARKFRVGPSSSLCLRDQCR